MTPLDQMQSVHPERFPKAIRRGVYSAHSVRISFKDLLSYLRLCQPKQREHSPGPLPMVFDVAAVGHSLLLGSKQHQCRFAVKGGLARPKAKVDLKGKVITQHHFRRFGSGIRKQHNPKTSLSAQFFITSNT